MLFRFLPRQKLAIAAELYWFLLMYIIAALFFWYIRLQQQNQQMANYKLMELVADDPSYKHSARDYYNDRHHCDAGKQKYYTGKGYPL